VILPSIFGWLNKQKSWYSRHELSICTRHFELIDEVKGGEREAAVGPRDKDNGVGD
jgi:hypothetical protein